MNPRMRSLLGTLARTLVTILLLAYVVTRVDLEQASSALQRMAWWGLAGTSLLLVVNMGLQWLRWHILVRAGKLELSPSQSLRILLAGLPLGLITPGRIGELGRGAVVAGEHDSVSIAGLTLLEHAYGLVGALTIAGVGMVISGYATYLSFTILLIFYALVIYLALHPSKLVDWTKRISSTLPGSLGARTSELSSRFAQGWRLTGRKVAFTAIAISVVQVSVVIAQFTICYVATAAHPSIIQVAGAWSIVIGAKYFLPITIGDIGVREGLAVAVFTSLGFPAPEALIASLTIYLVNVLLPSSIGAVILIGRK